MKTQNIIKERSYSFALRIIKLCQWLKQNKHFEISQQLLRSGTSIGANVEEALAAHSRRDFVHKMAIASKEARETNYWLRLLTDAEIIVQSQSQPIIEESDALIKILTSIVKTTQTTDK
jgi:four helix bundle protein